MERGQEGTHVLLSQGCHAPTIPALLGPPLALLLAVAFFLCTPLPASCTGLAMAAEQRGGKIPPPALPCVPALLCLLSAPGFLFPCAHTFFWSSFPILASCCPSLS